MSFTDTLKKSLGFEETEDNKDKPKNEFSLFLDDIRDALKPKGNPNNNQQYRQEPQKQYGQTPRSNMDKLLDLLLLLVLNLKQGQLRCMMSMRSLFQTNPIMRLSLSGLRHSMTSIMLSTRLLRSKILLF